MHSPHDPIPAQAHAIEDHVFKGVRYLAGEPWPLDGRTALEVRTQHAGRRIEYGPPPARLAKRAADRRAELARAASAKAAVETMTEAELEAATAPAAPAEKPQPQARRKAG